MRERETQKGGRAACTPIKLYFVFDVLIFAFLLFLQQALTFFAIRRSADAVSVVCNKQLNNLI